MHNDKISKKRLSKKAVAYWFIEELLALILTLLVFGGLLGCALYWDWANWLVYIFISLLVLFITSSLFGFCTLQKKFQYWSYAYDHHYFYIREGVLTKRFVVLPFEKIQAVTVIEGIMLNHFGLATVELQGIEKVYRVPALDKQIALNMQQVLAELTRQKEETEDETFTATHRI